MSNRAALGPLPHVGRANELTLLGSWLTEAATGRGGLHLIAGPSGIGKTRLALAVAERAEREQWLVGIGRVYAVESGVPYAVWSDALGPLLKTLDPAARTLLTRGGSWLGAISPALAATTGTDDPDSQSDGKARLLWNCAQFFTRLGEKRPLLLVLENLHLADSASLELLHFVARQLGQARVAVIGTYSESEPDRSGALRDVEQSLLAIGAARLLRLDALSQADTERLVCDVFAVDHPSARQLARRLYSWTRGHPFFVHEALKTLVEAGRIYERDGRWLGWEVEELGLPATVRQSVSQRLERLSPEARTVAGVAAVIGARVRFPVLRAACELDDDVVLTGLDEVNRAGILVESGVPGEDYEFVHPIIQDVLYDGLGVARARLLHEKVARALESSLGGRAATQADMLAFHFSRAAPQDSGAKALTYLAAAGRDALARHADRLAVDFLSAAVERSATTAAEGLVEDLALARQRLGEYDAAMALWQRARDEANARGQMGRRGAIERRIGLACYWSGRFEEAVAHFDAALATAAEASDDALRIQVRISRGTCLQSLGRPGDAASDLADALASATRLGDDALLARTHRALLFLHIFVGPPSVARSHGEHALALADSRGDKTVAWSAHYGLAALSGLTGDAPSAQRHLRSAEALADALQSPLLRAYSDEVEMQYAFASGSWDAGIALAEQTIAITRALNQRTLLPRVLVWATHFYIARGEFERAKKYLDEAWDVAVARGARGRPIEIHSQIAVYAGLANYYLATREYDRAREAGEQGLAIADAAGYAVWATYRLLPLIAEAVFWQRDAAHAAVLRERMKADCDRLQHRLGLVWVAAGDGLLARMHGDYPRSVELLRGAIDDLEKIPWVYDAARLRRWLASALILGGDRDAGLAELRNSHDVCARLGAKPELERAREMMKELGLRLPPARAAERSRMSAKLTAREADVARLIGERKANKAIAAALGISNRTVTTHVANIFAKLGVSSRGELVDRLRESR